MTRKYVKEDFYSNTGEYYIDDTQNWRDWINYWSNIINEYVGKDASYDFSDVANDLPAIIETTDTYIAPLKQSARGLEEVINKLQASKGVLDGNDIRNIVRVLSKVQDNIDDLLEISGMND